MRKFIEIQGIESGEIENVFRKHPDLTPYIDIFFEIEKLEPKVYAGVSSQVEDEYIQLIDSIDEFLFRPEILDKFKEEGYEVVPYSVKTTDDEETAKRRLEQEIEKMTAGIDQSLLDEQIKSEKKERVVAKARVEREIKLTRYDMGEDEYWGKEVLINELDIDKFNKCLIMLRTGFKFYTAKFAEKNFTMFKINENDRFIVQNKIYPSEYNQIFIGTENRSCYLLSKIKQNVDELYSNLRYSFQLVDEETQPLFEISDEMLFNHPILMSAFEEDVSFVAADELAQGAMLKTTDIIPTYFNAHLGLDKILVLAYCEKLHRTLSIEAKSEISEKIQKNIKEKKLNLEGFGVVPHSPKILDVLINENLIDNSYDLTSKGMSIRLMSSGSQSLHPDFQPFQYYKTNIKEEFKKAKEKYYSNYNGTNVYYVKNSQSQIKVAMALPGNLFKQWGFENAQSGNAFNPKWQTNQEFENFSEYLPFASEMKLKIDDRKGELELRGLKDKINFSNRSRYIMYVACKKLPMFVYAVNSSNFNYIKDMYKDRQVRLMGRPINSSMNIDGSGVADFFFSVVDENNNLLGLLPLEGVYKPQRGQLTIEDSTSDYEEISSTKMIKDLYRRVETPKPVWDFEVLLNQLKSSFPKFMDNPPYISDAGDLQWQTEDTDIKERTKEEEVLDISPVSDASKLKKIAKNPNLKEISQIDEELNAYQEVINDLDDEDKIQIQEEIDVLNKRKEKLLNE